MSLVVFVVSCMFFVIILYVCFLFAFIVYFIVCIVYLFFVHVYCIVQGTAENQSFD